MTVYQQNIKNIDNIWNNIVYIVLDSSKSNTIFAIFIGISKYLEPSMKPFPRFRSVKAQFPC